MWIEKIPVVAHDHIAVFADVEGQFIRTDAELLSDSHHKRTVVYAAAFQHGQECPIPPLLVGLLAHRRQQRTTAAHTPLTLSVFAAGAKTLLRRNAAASQGGTLLTQGFHRIQRHVARNRLGREIEYPICISGSQCPQGRVHAGHGLTDTRGGTGQKPTACPRTTERFLHQISLSLTNRGIGEAKRFQLCPALSQATGLQHQKRGGALKQGIHRPCQHGAGKHTLPALHVAVGFPHESHTDSNAFPLHALRQHIGADHHPGKKRRVIPRTDMGRIAPHPLAGLTAQCGAVIGHRVDIPVKNKGKAVRLPHNGHGHVPHHVLCIAAGTAVTEAGAESCGCAALLPGKRTQRFHVHLYGAQILTDSQTHGISFPSSSAEFLHYTPFPLETWQFC